MRFTFPILATDRPSVHAISRSEGFVGKLFLLLLPGSLLFLSSAMGMKVAAQSNSAPTINSDAPVLKTPTDDARYRIGPGDVLTIVVRKAPELSGPVRVDQRGMIHLPMIDGEVTAACRTEGELAAEIRTLYLEYKTNPSVEVFVTEFQSRPVAVIGAVNAPGQFRLQRQVRLNELISFAGGPSPNAGRVINLIHTGSAIICQKDASESKATPPVEGLGVFTLNDTINGKEGTNPFVQPGDIVQLPDADQIFVIGHVVQPRVIALKDKPITVSWAIAMAGGIARDGKSSNVRILRETAGGGKQELVVDLKAIQKRQGVDIALVPNDIVEVGSSPGKAILGLLQGAIPSAIMQGAVRVIP
ncbi:MAG TPA: hypothetical protein DC054_09975 [Blastocatellia bacterium]|nr:hypothetical protein [Blastocatellia bacterium]